jgi:hypothetical protein
MKWPMSHSFNEAIQNPNVVFSDVDLRTGEAVVGARGLPLPRSGNFADVYQLRGADGRDWAVKCFTRPVTGLGDRYAAVSESLTRAGLPFTVGFTYLAEGIRIDGQWWPVVKMEWVEGLLLNQVARENSGRSTILAALGQMWVKLCRRLRDSKVAHADLQHGNVLMVPGSRPGAYGLKLIDYDGMYVPALANQPSGETGHPAYQHPGRLGKNGYSPDVDRFPHLLIASALKALEVSGTPLWERYDTGDNLLFVDSDLQKPAESKLMRELWKTEHPGVQALVGRLAIASQRPMPQTPWLDQIAPEGEPLPLDEETRREAMRTLGLAEPISIPLPPETATEPVKSEVVAAPAPALPLPLDAVSDSLAFPIPEEKSTKAKVRKAGTRRVDETPVAKGPKRNPKDLGEPKKSSLLIYAVVGAIVLIGGVGTAVVLMGGKPKPEQTAENKSEEPDNPSPPLSTQPKAKDRTQKKEDHKENNPSNNKVVATPSEKTPGLVVPVEPVSSKPSSDPIKISVKELTRFKPGSDLPIAAEFNDDGQRLVFLSQPVHLRSYEVTTRKIKTLPDIPAGKGNAYQNILGNRVAIWRQGEQTITLSDIDTGLAAGTLPFPDLPQAPHVSKDAIIAISPDCRYVAAGRRSPRTFLLIKSEKMYEPVPFQLLDNATGKVILSFDWMSGMAQFTADSSRVLVVEGSGHGRWFKLPSGQPDGEWQFEEQVAGMALMEVKSASRDGQRLLCYGTARSQPLTYFVLDGLTGKLSSVLGQGFNHLSKAHLSGDGRIALLNLQTQDPPETWLCIFDTAWGKEAARINCAAISGITPITALSSDGRRMAVTFSLPNSREVIICDLFWDTGSTEVVVKAKDTTPQKDPVDLNPKWTSTVANLPVSRIYTDSATSLIVLGSNDGLIALDMKTGAPRKEFAPLVAGKTHELFPLENGRFGTLAVKRDDVEIWDSKTGKLLERLTVPSVPAGPPKAANLYLQLSRNKKYLAVGRLGDPGTDHPDLPFKVVEGGTRKVLVPADWHGGSAHFSADSSRVLIADWTGRCRWFKLPLGEQDGEWDFGPPQAGNLNIVHSISADGALVACSGPGPMKAAGTLLGLIDGRNGRVVRTFGKDYHANSSIALSENGRRAALLSAFKPDDDNPVRTIDVIDVATGMVNYRARIEPGAAIPTFDFTQDGKGLVVYDPAARKAYLFDSIDP